MKNNDFMPYFLTSSCGIPELSGSESMSFFVRMASAAKPDGINASPLMAKSPFEEAIHRSIPPSSIKTAHGLPAIHAKLSARDRYTSSIFVAELSLDAFLNRTVKILWAPAPASHNFFGLP
jgi:hypothetical protein